MKFKVLPYRPPQGPLPEQFSPGPRMYREGLAVEFSEDDGRTWVGNFQRGLGGASDAIAHPNGKHVIVVAGGQGYIVDPETRSLVATFGGQIESIITVPELQEIVFGNGISFTAIGHEGLRWETHRLSWDGMQALLRAGTMLSGEAYDPRDDSWRPFSVNLNDGHTDGGSYYYR